MKPRTSARPRRASGKNRSLRSQADGAWSRADAAARLLTGPDGEPWRVRPYQRNSLESSAERKVHCDGRDVGKTSEIEIAALWAASTLAGRRMLIATQCEHHLFPLMHRVARRFESAERLPVTLVELKRTPSWYMRFANGFELWGRIAGPRGVNFQGMHVDWQIVDEAQEMTEISWGELYQALNGGGWRWVYGVPNGRRDTFHRMTQDPDTERYNWPSTLNPDYTPEKDAELARLYGGRASAGYVHRVLGLHGSPAHGVFDLDDYLACVDEALDAVSVVLREGDAFDAPEGVAAGDYYLGCDLGYARDPSEFVVYRAAGPHLIQVLRVRLEGVNYARQESVIRELDAAYHFRGIGIDSGNNGRAIAHRLMASSFRWCEKVRAFEFGGTIETPALADGSVERRPVKEWMTELLQRRMAERTMIFPRLADRERQYAAHSYRVNAQGRIVYEKGNDHLIDADRCAVLRHYLDTEELPDASPEPRIEGF